MDHQQANQDRAVVFAPFFSVGLSANRPRMVASALAEFMPVHVVTCDFDHSLKARRDEIQCKPYERIVYLKTRPYASNISIARLLSHLLFSFKAAQFFRRNLDQYRVVYVTAPLNTLAWLILSLAGSRTKIVDVVDIWPDVLPFPFAARRVLAPLLSGWKWLFKSSIRKCDLLMAVSDEFLSEAATYATERTKLRRFYIGCRKLQLAVPKESIFTLAYVGNIGHLYDFETLVDVLAEGELRKCVQLFIIGKGDRQDWLIGQLHKRQIRHRFFGVVYDDSRLAGILGSCHVGFNGYVNTTAAFSYKASTYLAAGLPVLNSMSGDLRRLIERYALGANYETGNRTELREGLLYLRQHRTYSRVAANCVHFFASQLEESRVSSDIRKFLYDKIKGVAKDRV